MSDVIAFPKGQLSAADRKRLTAAGIVFVEMDDPKAMHAVSCLSLVQTAVDGDSVVRSAIKAMAETHSDDVRSRFIRALNAAINGEPQ